VFPDNSPAFLTLGKSCHKDVLDMHGDRPGARAEDQADLVIGFALCDPWRSSVWKIAPLLPPSPSPHHSVELC
jgi:hypothetical protein